MLLEPPSLPVANTRLAPIHPPGRAALADRRLRAIVLLFVERAKQRQSRLPRAPWITAHSRRPHCSHTGSFRVTPPSCRGSWTRSFLSSRFA